MSGKETRSCTPELSPEPQNWKYGKAHVAKEWLVQAPVRASICNIVDSARRTLLNLTLSLSQARVTAILYRTSMAQEWQQQQYPEQQEARNICVNSGAVHPQTTCSAIPPLLLRHLKAQPRKGPGFYRRDLLHRRVHRAMMCDLPGRV